MRWPSEGWLTGSIDDLAACIENVALSERLLAEGTQILEQSIGEAAGKLRETANIQVLERMAQSLHQEDGEQTSRMAMAIVANALVFHTAIVDAHGIPNHRRIAYSWPQRCQQEPFARMLAAYPR